jgi:lycopene cyclase domain-containing protein
MKGEYLIVLGATLAFPLVLSFDRKLRLYERWDSLAKTILVTSCVFWLWDIVAVHRGHWWFNEDYVLGVQWLGLPLEEWLFFLVISFISIFTWESIKYFLRHR